MFGIWSFFRWQFLFLLFDCARLMKKVCSLSAALLFFSLAILCRAEEEPPWKIESQDTNGWVEIDPNGLMHGYKGVVVTNRNVVLTADEVIANQETQEVQAEGSVTIVSLGHIWRGTNIIYNFKTTKMRSGNFKTGQSPFYISGESLSGTQSNQFYSATNTIITTDNFAEPAHKIRARRMVLVPGQYFEVWDATLYLRGVPVFYYPHFKRYLGSHSNYFQFTPGYGSRFGPFLLSSYHSYWNEHLETALHLDLRLKRGIGVGPEADFHLGKFGDGTFTYYYLHDEEPNVDNVTGVPMPAHRERVNFVDQATLATNLTAKLVARYQSDPQIIRDFFEGEYRKNTQPASYAEINKIWPNFSLDFFAQPRLNNFFENVERLPEIKLSAYRQQVAATPVYYESESSFDYLERKFTSGRFANTNSYNGTNDFSAARADTFHQFVLPKNFFGWLNVTPRVGGRVTYYSDVTGPTLRTNDQVRGVFNTGAEFSTKASRVFPGAENKFLDVHELRHIIEPSVNYVYVPSPTRRPPQLPQFDYEGGSLRLLPIDFPQYNDIDAIDSQNVLRLTLQNRLQTKRADGVDNLVNWAVYTDWRLQRRTNQTTFADLFSDLDFRPRHWMTFNSQTRYDIANSRWREAYHSVLMQPNDTWSVSLAHRYLINDDPEFRSPFDPHPLGHNTFLSSVYYRFNENWGARASHRFEARDGKLEEQLYTIYRDLRSWTGALTLRLRENRSGQPSDFSILMTFSLKAFPRFRQGADSGHSTSLLGG